MEYKQTLNMNKSGFPMRGGLPMREPDMLKHWQELDLYNELLKKNEGKPRFALHDGPPFSNGALHMGHALNKCIKDFMIRSAAMRGYYTPYIPGWDNHGMPIESAIIKQNKLNHKAMSVSEFRSACHEFADHYIDVQRDGFKRMGVVGDWEHPYKTMDPGFEAQEVRVFGRMYQNGHIYKGLKPVYWCPHDETALAEAEIEYKDDPCTTVYVKFPMHDDQGKLGHLDHSKLYFVIWTTTVWTLPGNLAIALHPDESYAVVKAPNGEMYIMAEALTEKVMKIGGFDSYEIVETHPGSFFENMLADHPFLPKTSRLVLADYVTMDSGTGCVHTAPGFGADDYVTCKRYGMDMVVPVDDQGKHTAYAGKYEGMTTDASNPVILQDMKDNGTLFASEDIVHSYPHCWRCKQPIIFRATPQWFCSVDSFKDEAIAACEDVRWVPAWGKDRMRSMILERTDWCISRQRRWGLPIPVFYCADCGNHLTIQRVARNRKMDNFSCATYRKKKKGLCSCHRILVSDLETIVKEDLQKVCEYVLFHEKEFTDEYLSGSKRETVKFQAKTKAELKRLYERQEDIGRIIRKLYEDNVNGRITDERFDFLAKSYEDEGNDLKTKIQKLKNALASSVQDEEKLSKFLKVVKSYTKIEELTPEILNSFIEKIYIGETEKYDGRKMQEVEIIYKFVGAINLPQYSTY